MAEAITNYRAALEVRTREQFPSDWAETQDSLADALCDQARLTQGADATRLLAEAVTNYCAALEIRTRQQFPSDWLGR